MRFYLLLTLCFLTATARAQSPASLKEFKSQASDQIKNIYSIMHDILSIDVTKVQKDIADAKRTPTYNRCIFPRRQTDTQTLLVMCKNAATLVSEIYNGLLLSEAEKIRLKKADNAFLDFISEQTKQKWQDFAKAEYKKANKAFSDAISKLKPAHENFVDLNMIPALQIGLNAGLPYQIKLIEPFAKKFAPKANKAVRNLDLLKTKALKNVRKLN